MSRDYVAQYQPTIFIGGHWVDDAQACEWQRTEPKEPLYGFRDEEFREMARGQRLVHGILDLNFRFKGYLTLALSMLETLEKRTTRGLMAGTAGARTAPVRLREILHAAREGNVFHTSGIDPRTLSIEQRQQLLERPFEDFDIEGFNKLSSAIQDDLWGGGSASGRGLDATSKPADPMSTAQVKKHRPHAGSWPVGFDMSIVYDLVHPSNPRQQQDMARVEILRDVHIVGESKMINNTVPGGARAVMERYQFIARTVE